MVHVGQISSISICLLAVSIRFVDCSIAAMCVQFGIGPIKSWKYGNDGKIKEFYYTIAAQTFDAKWLGYLTLRYTEKGNFNYSILAPKSDGSCPWEIPICPKTIHFTEWPEKKIGCYVYHDWVYDEYRIEPCVANDKVRMDMFLVKQAGRILHGWVHVEIELLDKSEGEIELIYIQMRDESFNAIGQFVTADVIKGATCKPSKDYLATPKHYEFFPCSATGLREAKTSAGIMMAKKEYYINEEVVNNKWVHDKPIARGVHFLWKLEESWCSRHQKIQPFAYILTSNQRIKGSPRKGSGSFDHLLYRKVPSYWLHAKWFGAADIIFPSGELDCSELAINDNTGQVTPAAANSWFQSKTSVVTLEGDNWHPKYRSRRAPTLAYRRSLEICNVDPIRDESTRENVPVFSGRCKYLSSTSGVSRDEFQGCNTNASSTVFEGILVGSFQDYHEYIANKSVARKQFCEGTCPRPTSDEDFTSITGNKLTNDVTMTTEASTPKKNPLAASRVVKLSGGRRFHGITYSFMAIFVVPLSIFVSRNYKETFMRSRCYGVHLWYWAHIGGVVATLCLTLSGHAAISPFFKIWGRSEDSCAEMHRNLGYASLGIFGFLVICGGLRVREPGLGRLFTITLHALLGFLHHWFNLTSLIYSTWIPQSPSLHDCDRSTGMPEGFSLVFWVAAGWTGVDFIFHLMLTFIHVLRDRAIGIWRGWYFPIVPLAANDQMMDMAGEKLRKILLYIYIALAVIAASICSWYVMSNKMPDHCKWGKTTCKHFFGCTKLALKYEKWYINHGGEI